MSLLSFPAHEIRAHHRMTSNPIQLRVWALPRITCSSIFDFWLKADFVSIFVREKIVLLWMILSMHPGGWISAAGSICELSRYVDDHHGRSGVLQRSARRGPAAQHLSLQILLHIHAHRHPATAEAPHGRGGAALGGRSCGRRSGRVRPPFHAPQFLELA